MSREKNVYEALARKLCEEFQKKQSNHQVGKKMETKEITGHNILQKSPCSRQDERRFPVQNHRGQGNHREP